MRRVWRAALGVSGMLALSFSLAACSGVEPSPDGTRASANDHVSTPPVATDSAPSGCVDASGLTTAKDGVISAGPFKENRGYWRQQHGTKLWVATSVDQKPTTAVISAERLNATTQSVVKRRGPGTIATPDGDPPGLFFPGVVRLPLHGTWQITVTIGKDSGCFRVHV